MHNTHPHIQDDGYPLCIMQGVSQPVDVCVLQVDGFADVVAEDEGEHRVLHEVVERAARVFVEVRQVLEVCDLTGAPQLGERRDVPVLQQVGKVRGQDVVVDVIPKLNPGNTSRV